MSARIRAAATLHSAARLLFISFFSVPIVTLASDGRIEISQALIDAGGGFPYVIHSPGSYELTGDIMVPDGGTGIQIAADQVTLDLNGFAIRGTHECGQSGCKAGTGMGVQATMVESELARDATLRNGIVSGFGADCLVLGANSSVNGLIVRHCGGSGIDAAEHAVVSDNRVSDCGGWGLQFAAAALYGNNIIAGVNRLGGTGFIAGGTANEKNICDDSPCLGPGRRYYLTQGTFDGDHLGIVCSGGFHLASIAELLNPSALVYDTNLGIVHDSYGSGPPTGVVLGWVNGEASSCNGGGGAWTSNSPAVEGLTASFDTGFFTDTDPHWDSIRGNCNSPPRSAWCIEN